MEKIVSEVTSFLEQTLYHHGLRTSRNNEELLISGSGVVFSAAVFAHNNPKLVQLDIRAQAPLLGNKLLIESFAGFGDSQPEAVKDAFGKFQRASLHVMLAVLVERKLGTDQVEWETWEASPLRWQVCMGPLLSRHLQSADLKYSDLLEQMKERLLLKLNAGCHWLRVYFMKNNGQRIGSEALLDNDDWPEGQSLLEAWARLGGTYSLRNFLMLVPEDAKL